MENLMERLEKELEEEKMARIKRRRWRRRFMLLMVFGVIMFSISAVTAAFTKSLPIGFMVLGFACIPPYGLYEFYNDC